MDYDEKNEQQYYGEVKGAGLSEQHNLFFIIFILTSFISVIIKFISSI